MHTEERFNRKKMSTDFPVKSINWSLKCTTGRIKFENLDYIVESLESTYKMLIMRQARWA